MHRKSFRWCHHHDEQIAWALDGSKKLITFCDLRTLPCPNKCSKNLVVNVINSAKKNKNTNGDICYQFSLRERWHVIWCVTKRERVFVLVSYDPLNYRI
jgi:hypothetical protein